MVWTIFVALLVLWLTALVLNVGSGTVHILAVIAVLLLIYQMIKRRSL